MDTFQVQEEQRLGAPFVLSCAKQRFTSIIYPEVDQFIERQDVGRPLVLDVGYITHDLEYITGQRTYISTIGKVYSERMHVRAVTPNLFQVVLPGLSTVRERRIDSGNWLVTEELYTPHGSQGAMVGTLYKDKIGLKVNQSMLFQVN